MTAKQSTSSTRTGAAHATWLRFRRVRARLDALVRACGAVAIGFGSVVLLGWALDLPQLRSGLAGAIEMVPNAALALVLSGASLILAVPGQDSRTKKLARRSTHTLGIVVAALGVMTAAEYFLEVDFGIDQALVPDIPHPFSNFAGRMSLYTAIAFAFLGAALAALPMPKLRALTTIGAGCTAVIGLISLTGYAWGVIDLLANDWVPPMAVFSAIAFPPLGAGTWLATYRYSKGKRSLRLLLDPIKLKIMASFVGALLVLALMGGLTYGMATDEPTDAQAIAALRADPELHRNRQRALIINYLLLVSTAMVLLGVFATIQREMRARTRAERAVRRSSAKSVAAEHFLDSVIQNIPITLFVKDAEKLRFVRLNRAGERLSGRSEADVIGRTSEEIFPLDVAESFSANDRLVLANGEVLDVSEDAIHTPGGTRLLLTRKIPLLDGAGRPTHVLGISEDVTEARAKQRQIDRLTEALSARAAEVERVSRARSAFLATMSHEIRTPMNGMLGMLELLGLSSLDDRQRAALSVVSQSGQSLLRIIDDILDLSKIEAGKMELREEVASVEAVVRAVQHIHSPLAADKGLEIRVAIDPALCPAAWVDPVRLRQILNNFVSNAVKFTSVGCIEILVDVQASDATTQSIRVSVTDTGMGISVDQQQGLFQPFVQAIGASGAAGGTGLGLAISRQLAQLMGGTVDLASEPGRGTTLGVQLRLRTASAELLPPPPERKIDALRQMVASRRPAPTVAEAEADGTLVLLVDDHPVNRLVLQQQLESLGYAVQAAVDGHEALARWRSGRFGLVLTDCHMPGLDGYELTGQIRQDEAAGPRRTPVIACTATVMDGEVDKCLQAGMDDVVFKPVELRHLLDKLERWLPLPTTVGRERPPEDWQPVRIETLDTSFLAATWGSDPKAVRRIVDSYIRSARDDCSVLRQAMAGRDLKAVQQVAHRMLGASRTVGAKGLAESILRVSTARVDGNWDDITAGVRAVEAEFDRLVAKRRQPL